MNILLIGLLILGSSACSTYPEQLALHDFGLPVVADGFQANVRIEAPEWLQDNRIRYRLLYASPTQVRFYTLDRWIASPPELFEQQLLVGGKLPGRRLIIRLLDFEQQFDAPDSARAMLRLSVSVDANDNTPVATQIMSLEQATTTPDAKGAVDGLARLTRQAVDKIQDFLSGLSGGQSTKHYKFSK